MAILKRKRVACLYRVSTKKQLKSRKRISDNSIQSPSQEEDMELQRKESMRFIKDMEQEGWEFTGIDYVEGGVSAFKTHTSRRKEVMRALEDARNGVYDILLVYKLDRFGRRSSESLGYAQKFEKYCEIWVVDKKRQFKSNGSMDELIAFIEFWHSKQSSEDTKVRVRDAMKQIHETGIWTGGNPPYGYENHPSQSNTLLINNNEAKTVEVIYDLYISKGYGFMRISSFLNESEEHNPRIVEMWSRETISSILKNPIYKGYLSYGKTTNKEGEWGTHQVRVKEDKWSISTKKWDNYVIVSEEVWEQAQLIRGSRIGKMAENGILEKKETSRPINNTSSLLLTGLIECGYCGGSMCMHHDHVKKNAGTDKEKVYRYTNYKCLNRIKRGKSGCNGDQAMYRQTIIEESVIDEIKELMEVFSDDKIVKNIIDFSKQQSNQTDRKQSELVKELQKWKKAKEAAETMIDKILMGEDTPFDVNTLNERLVNAKLKIDEVNEKINEMSAVKNVEKSNQDNYFELVELIRQWATMFDQADILTKKQMVGKVVEKVIVIKGRVSVEFDLKVREWYEIIVTAKLEASNSAS